MHFLCLVMYAGWLGLPAVCFGVYWSPVLVRHACLTQSVPAVSRVSSRISGLLLCQHSPSTVYEYACSGGLWGLKGA